MSIEFQSLLGLYDINASAVNVESLIAVTVKTKELSVDSPYLSGGQDDDVLTKDGNLAVWKPNTMEPRVAALEQVTHEHEERITTNEGKIGELIEITGTATPNNVANAVVKRDGTGSFEATDVTLSGKLESKHAVIKGSIPMSSEDMAALDDGLHIAMSNEPNWSWANLIHKHQQNSGFFDITDVRPVRNSAGEIQPGMLTDLLMRIDPAGKMIRLYNNVFLPSGNLDVAKLATIGLGLTVNGDTSLKNTNIGDLVVTGNTTLKGTNVEFLTVTGNTTSGSVTTAKVTNPQQLVLEQTGDWYGSNRLLVQNRGGKCGLEIDCSETTAGVCDLDYTAGTKQIKTRLETRSGSSFRTAAENTEGELVVQQGSSGNIFAIGANKVTSVKPFDTNSLLTANAGLISNSVVTANAGLTAQSWPSTTINHAFIGRNRTGGTGRMRFGVNRGGGAGGFDWVSIG